jgi:hypothetical protein
VYRHEADDRPVVIGTGFTARERDARRSERHLRAWAASRRHFTLGTAVASRVISLAQVLGRPVCDAGDTRIGRVSDIVVRWDADSKYPPVTGVLFRARNALAVVRQSDVTLTQAEVRLRSNARVTWRPAWRADDLALARDVLDCRLADPSGVHGVRAIDVYFLNGPRGWELAGVDVGVWPCGREHVSRRWSGPGRNRVVDWTHFQAFVPRFAESAGPLESAPTPASGIT